QNLRLVEHVAQVLFDERIANGRIAIRPVGLPQRCGVHRLNPQSWGNLTEPAGFGAAKASKSGPASSARTASAACEPSSAACNGCPAATAARRPGSSGIEPAKGTARPRYFQIPERSTPKAARAAAPSQPVISTDIGSS